MMECTWHIYNVSLNSQFVIYKVLTPFPHYIIDTNLIFLIILRYVCTMHADYNLSHRKKKWVHACIMYHVSYMHHVSEENLIYVTHDHTMDGVMLEYLSCCWSLSSSHNKHCFWTVHINSKIKVKIYIDRWNVKWRWIFFCNDKIYIGV